MLSGDRYDKTIPSARKRRMVYVDAMISDVESNGVAVEVNTTELDRQTMVETYDTVVELTARYPDRQTTWVFGADSTETMGEWKEGDNLLRKIDKLLIEREGSVVNPLARRAVRLMVQTPAVSSTEVRRRMERGEDCRELVSAGVIGVL
jgi:nicotinic acid mononucleotide adenylyltransferase